MNIIKQHYLHVILCISGLTLLAGCSTYHNVTAYFNTYYNAKKVFGEAVREVEKTPQKDRDTNYFRPYVIPKAVAGKFEKVIEKCSKVIQLYPQSSFLDRSLIMIGQSYVYRGETESAIRKFREFLENFPSSSLRFESKLWLAIALYQSGKSDESLLTLRELIPEVTAAGEDDMVVLGMMLEAQIMVDREEYEEAIISYEKGMDVSADDDLISRLHYYRAQCYERLNRHRQAAEAYARVPEYTKDFAREFQARLKSGAMQVASGDYDAAFQTFSDLSSEKLKNDERGLVELERARTYMTIGDTVKAFELYETIDSTYKRTDAAAKAYYERGEMYDRYYSDYPRAKFYYEKAKAEFPASEVAPLAQKKLITFIQYFKIHENLDKYDSLLVLALTPDSVLQQADSSAIIDSLSGDVIDSPADSVIKSVASEVDSISMIPDKKDTAVLLVSDSLAIASAQKSDTLFRRDSVITAESKVPPVEIRAPGDSLTAKSDTTKKVKEAAPKAVKQPLSPDSLRSIIAKNKYELASLFFLQINHYDSAVVWYRHLVDEYPTSEYIPRSLYALSEIERSRGDTTAVDSLYSLILSRYDTTEYARMVKINRGIEVESTGEDSAENDFRRAETLLFSDDTTGAIRAYAGVADKYPGSPVAPKALYAVGWILENYCSLNDSAFFWYKRLLKEYPASRYAAEVKAKVSVKENPEKLSEFIKINEIKAVPKTTKQGELQKPGVARQQDENADEQNPNSRLNRRDAPQDEDEEEVDPEEQDPPVDEEDEDPGLDDGGGI
jgi:TolA-binding protein